MKRSVQNKRPDTVTTPEPVVGRNLRAVRPTLTKTWLAIADHEVPAVMTYRSGGSFLGEKGTPHPEPMWRVVGAEVQRLPLVPADLW